MRGISSWGWTILIPLLCLSVACAPLHEKRYAPPHGLTSETGARLRGSVHPDSGFMFNRLEVDVYAVDGGVTRPSIRGGTSGLFASSVLLSTAEDHQIEFCISQSKPDIASDDTQHGCGVMTVNLAAGKSYLLRSTWTGRGTNRCESVWIENQDTGELASPKVLVEMRDHLNWKYGNKDDQCRAAK